MKYLIVGGVAGGATAAARLRRNDESATIVLVERGPYISFANCGLPYHLSGAIAERERLLVTSEEAFVRRYAIEVKSRTEALAIDRAHKTVRLRDLASGNEYDESFDKLLLAPGAEPIRPPLPGLDGRGVFTLRSLPDLDRIMAFLQGEQPRRAVVVGGGFIGVEVAENLVERGVSTMLVEAGDQVLAPLDPEMAAVVQAHLRDRQVGLFLSDPIERIEQEGDLRVVHLRSGRRLAAELVVLAIGVRPEAALARAAGLTLGASGGIKVDAFLQTSDPAIYAVGDAIEVVHAISGKPALIALAGPANRQGRLAADNMVLGNTRRYRGSQGTAIVKVFDLAAASTGLNEKQLKLAGVPYHATITHGASHAGYYPGAMPLVLKLLYAPDGKILGAQAVGSDGVDKRIDVIATAMRAGLAVGELAELELAYAPPFGSAKDPVNVAGYVAGNVLDGTHEAIDWQTLYDLPRDEVQLVDVRTAEEYRLGTIAGARHIDVDTLRARLSELDRARPVVVFCQVGLRGYLAYRILKQHGFAQVRNLSGGYKTYALATQPVCAPAEPTVEPHDVPRIGRGGDQTVQTLDAVGLQCPGPVMKTYQAVSSLPPGGLLSVTASDPAFGRDIRAWAAKTGNAVLSVDAAQGLVTALIQKGGALAAPASGGVAVRDKTTLVVFSGELDRVMASLIIANGALAMGKPVSVFFTFWGLNVLRRAHPPVVTKSFMDRAFGAMMPRGAERLNTISSMNFAGLGARLIRKVMRDKRVDLPAKLLQDLVQGGAQLIACQMSMDVMGIRQEELIDGVTLGGVATFLGEAGESGTSLFI
ncbi:FAD-dependent oxidoreductase [Paludibacterium purpuratum]|uniref:tRNA 2-thiouridine synthesizing protein A n=1 Tax=Paludibacterium purpuratum TaxID=1144873 RepID=A0A4R7BAG8_9NEIS|nr:FAD-dependent oxidoreductase [Paludibacterium purpuratum]TDR81940.1 tRNA 2-thiouridine synthesizing protein A [Paludibacterium purpuratum]